eukprot:jgi/Tetstr1/466505/TSEL_011012.t1
MRKPIEINSRVAARRGPFEPGALGRVRQNRALKFGNVVESVANNQFRIMWDDGTESCETTNVLKLQPTGAGALPQRCLTNRIYHSFQSRPSLHLTVASRYGWLYSRRPGRLAAPLHRPLPRRMHTTMAGIHVTDCWKLAKHHLPRHHPLKESTAVNFADMMCKALIYNGLTGEVEPTRRTERVLADITNEPPLLPHSIMHLGKHPGNDNAIKQARCTMCRVDDDNVGWTSYKCPDCDIPLCIPSKRRKGVACWTRHRRMTAQQLAVHGVNRRAD